MLAQWEGRGDSDSSDSDIQSYSEGESQLTSHAESAAPVSCQPIAIVTVSSDQDFASDGGERGMEVERHSRKQRGRKGGRATQPRPDVPIEDFHSPSSSDSADGVLHLNLSKPVKKPGRPFPPPSARNRTQVDHVTITTPPSSPLEPTNLPDDTAISSPPSSPPEPPDHMTNSPDHMIISTPLSSPPALDDLADHMTISTPPSSPEQASMEGEVGGFKTSEWVRQVR